MERLLRLVEGLVSVEPVGELTLKGFSRPVAAYNIAGLREPRTDGLIAP